MKYIQLKDQDINVEVWIYDNIQTSATFRECVMNAKIILFTFDLTNLNSLNGLKTWCKLTKQENQSFQSFSVGTKWDLMQKLWNESDGNLKYAKKYCLITKKARRFAAKIDAPLIYTSSNKNLNIKVVFKSCILKTLEKEIEIEENSFDHTQPIREWNVAKVIKNYVDPKWRICIEGYLRLFCKMNIPMELIQIIVKYTKCRVRRNPLMPAMPTTEAAKQRSKQLREIKRKKMQKKLAKQAASSVGIETSTCEFWNASDYSI